MAAATEQELKDRLSLIETMIAEGRRTTESFVLWGVAYFVAILWTALGHSVAAWPVTMISACVLTGVLVGIKGGSKPGTTMGRAIASIWVAMGISMLVLFFSLGLSGRIDQHILIAAATAMLGMANAASSLILKWKLQAACAVVWWATSAFACFGKSSQATIVFLAAIFFCQIVFGVYGMIAEARQNWKDAAHA